MSEIWNATPGWMKTLIVIIMIVIVVRFAWKFLKIFFIRKLATHLKHNDPAVRRLAAEQLGVMGGSYAIRMLSSALQDIDESVRTEATKALSKLGQPPEVPLKPRSKSGQEREDYETVRSDKPGAVLLDVARSHIANGDLEGAMTLAQKALHGRFDSQAQSLRKRGDWQGELNLLKAEESIYREIGDEKSIQQSIEDQIKILREHGRGAEAEVIIKTRERTVTGSGEKSELVSKLDAQAVMLHAIGDRAGAMNQFKQMESLCRELGDKASLAVSLSGQMGIYLEQRDQNRALAIIKETTGLYRELNDLQNLSGCISNHAEILRSFGDYHQSIALHQEAEVLFRQLGANEHLMNCLAHQGTIKGSLQDLDGAADLFSEATRLAREAGKRDDLARFLGSQATVFINSEPARALEMAEEALRIANELKMTDMTGVFLSLVDMAKTRLAQAGRGGTSMPAVNTSPEKFFQVELQDVHAQPASPPTSSRESRSARVTRDRVVRIFISSTFRDMQEERDHLVKHIFPELKRRCREREVEFVEVDLRWGVTEEQAERGEVLPICLSEIERCRPYFIGLLGERYGWVPERFHFDLVESHPWLKESMTRSVTELEILHGVLRNPEMNRRAFFYFRDPSYIKSIPEEIRSDFTVENEAARSSLAALKSRIRASGLPLVENYSTPESVGQSILDDLWRVFNEEFPADSEPDPLDREAAEQDAFARSRAKVYIGRKEYFDRLNEHVRGETPPLVLLGESGTGKSALIANWAAQYQTDHPDDFLLTHFIGSTPQSANWAVLLRRIMSELKLHFDLQMEVPEKQDELRQGFVNWLNIAADRGRIIIVLDALDQIEDRNSASDLIWLPEFIPSNVRMVLSTLPGRSLESIRKRGWPTFEISALHPDERTQLIRAYLGRYVKSLNNERIARISSSEQTANPLFLRTLLEELRLFGIHEKLDERIDYYLASPMITDLFDRILERFEMDFELNRPGLVRDAMRLIWSARMGLTESELLALLGTPGNPLPHAIWSPLYLALEELLVSRSGNLTFFHDYFRLSVARRYLPNRQEQTSGHLVLADYFSQKGIEPRVVQELPWQLAAAGAWQRLHDLLSDLLFFDACWKINLSEVKSYWAQIEERTPLRLVEAYRPYMDTPKNHVDYLPNLTHLLFDMGHIEEAKVLQEFLIKYFRRTENKTLLAYALGNLITTLLRQGDLVRVAELQNECEQIHREQGNMVGLAQTLVNKARTHLEQSHLDEALNLYSEAESICSGWGEKAMWATCLNNIATIHFYHKNYDRAMQMYKKFELACRETGDQIGLASSYGNQANILIEQNHLDEAMSLFQEQERLCILLGDRKVLSPSLAGQAFILDAQGQSQHAAELYQQAEQIVRDLGDRLGLGRLLHEEAEFYRKHGDQDKATVKEKESQDLLGTMPSQSIVNKLIDRAKTLRAGGDLDGALSVQIEIEQICRLMGEKQAIVACLVNQGNIYFTKKDYDKAMSLYKEQESICREIGEKEVLANSLFNQSLVLEIRGDMDGAMMLQKEVERICQETGNLNTLQASLGGRANILASLGALNEAVTLYTMQASICRELGNSNALAISLANQANFLAKRMGKPKEAMALAQEAYDLAMKSGLAALAKQTKKILDSIHSRQ